MYSLVAGKGERVKIDGAKFEKKKKQKNKKKKKKEKEKSIENQTALCVVRGEYEKKEEKRKKGKVVATRLTPCK